MGAQIAVLILTKNEEKNIVDCISSVSFADEILVIDSGSKDETQALARQAGARVLTHPMDEQGFAGQRNFALAQTKADWVFYLDADERVSGALAAEIKAAIRQTADVLRSHIKIGCTGCRYCMPCPMGVDIPDNFSIWNKLGMFGNKDAIRQQWTARFPDAEKAIHCVRCGKCEAVCPQHLPIRNSLAKLQTELDNL